MPDTPPHSQTSLVKACSIWRALDVIGDVPILLILESLWMGLSRFNALQERTGLLKALLSNRLKRLIDTGLLIKRPVLGQSSIMEYALTSKGAGLFQTTLMLYQWEREWGTSKQRKSLRLKHETCGAILDPETACDQCSDTFDLIEVDWSKGAGAGSMPATYQRRRNQTHFNIENPSLLKGSVEILGDRWSALIMRAVFSGHNRFDDIQGDAGIPPNTLSSRLKTLLSSDVLTSRPYQDRPVRLEYYLTIKGLEYYKVIMMLMIWGDTHFSAAEGPPIDLIHMSCGAHFTPRIICANCREELVPQSLSIVGAKTP